MMKSDDLEDLIALGRRGELGDADERRLREVLAASPEAQALYEAGRAFDADAPVEAGDERTVARIVTAVERRVRRAERTQPRWLPRLLFAAMLLSGAAVAAVEYRAVISRPASPSIEEPAARADERDQACPRPRDARTRECTACTANRGGAA
jgi:hypothetical protein